MSRPKDTEFTHSSPAQKLAMKCERLFQQFHDAGERGENDATMEHLEALALDADYELNQIVDAATARRLRNLAFRAIYSQESAA